MYYLGIDVAKAKLDCVLLNPESRKRKNTTIPNSAEGVAALLDALQAWGIEAAQVHAVLELTASYHELAALALCDAGCMVSLVNPHTAAMRKPWGVRSKTDAMILLYWRAMALQRNRMPWHRLSAFSAHPARLVGTP